MEGIAEAVAARAAHKNVTKHLIVGCAEQGCEASILEATIKNALIHRRLALVEDAESQQVRSRMPATLRPRTDVPQ